MIKLAPHGLTVESPDQVEVEDFEPARAVSGHDTVPMVGVLTWDVHVYVYRYPI